MGHPDITGTTNVAGALLRLILAWGAMLAETTQSDAVAGGVQTPAAELREVSKVYGSFAALKSVSLEFAAGSCTMVLGENGAGKSTLLRMVAGLISPSRGTVQVLGGSADERRGRVAYMSHAAMLYDELSAMENLRYFAGLGSGGCCDCVGGPEMALKAVGLDPGLKRPVGQYSQGMRQRASLARVIQSDPELLLLDEPFSNVDVESAETMVKLISDFRSWPVYGQRASDRRTVIFTTHQAHLGEPIADRTLTMREGRVASSTTRGQAV
jgi:ABC-type multidrug transport system ATPase subunit